MFEKFSLGNDWRFGLLFLLFAAIPATGAWHYTRVYRAQTELRPIGVAELSLKAVGTTDPKREANS